MNRMIFFGIVATIVLLFSVPAQAAEFNVYDLPFAAADLSGIVQTNSVGDGVILNFSMANAGDRAYWDLPIKQGLPGDATSFVVDGSLVSDGYLTGMTLHLRSGMLWYDAVLPPLASTRSRVSIPLSRFRDDDGQVCDAIRADMLRISIWAGASNATGTLALAGLQTRRDIVAIANMGEDVALARCRTLFDVAGIPYAEIEGDLARAGDFTLVAMPTTPQKFDVKSLAALRQAVRNGTKLLVFYTASRELDAILGIRAGEWKGERPALAWLSMMPIPEAMGGFNLSIPQFSENVIPPYVGENAPAVAFLGDSLGHQTSLPACVVSDSGAWFAHIPPLPTPPATEFIRQICLRFVPEFDSIFAVKALMANESLIESPPPEAGLVIEALRLGVETRTALSKIPLICLGLRNALAASVLQTACPTGEVRAVWDARASYRSVAAWETLLPRLASQGINTIFVWIGNGRSAALAMEPTGIFGDDRFREMAAVQSIGVHAWLYTLAVGQISADQRDMLSASGRLMVSASGATHDWLCPVNAENRKMVEASASLLATSGVDGIHLDYVRFPNAEGCFCASCRVSFEAVNGAKVADWPADVVGRGSLAESYRTFQTWALSDFVAGVSSVIRQVRPGTQVSAAVFPEVVSAAALRQDWPSWIDAGIVDFVAPMTYQMDTQVFASQVTRAVAASRNQPTALIAGIGTTADDPGPDAYGVAQQIEVCRQKGLRGFAFFSLDKFLFDSILPHVSLLREGEKE